MIISKENYPISYVCIIPKCNQLSRIIEIENDKKSHQHNLHNSNHIITLQEFRAYIKQHSIQQQAQEQQQLENYIQKLNQLQDIIQNLIQKLQRQYEEEIQAYNLKIIDLLEKQDKNKQRLLINEVLHFSIHYDNKNNRDPLQQIVKICEEIRNFSQFFQDVEYYDHIIKVNRYRISCQISKQDKFIQFSSQKEIQIVNLMSKKGPKVRIRLVISASKLSDDSQFLHSDEEIKLIHKQKLDPFIIHLLRPIKDNKLIVFQRDISSIKIIDMQSKKVNTLKNQEPKNYFYSLDYDESQQTVIVDYMNKQIKVLSTDGEVLINKLNAHERIIQNIQVFNNNNILSNCGSALKIWQVDYNLRTLTLTKQLVDFRCIYAPQSLLDNQVIIVFQLHLIHFYDKDLNLIHKIHHDSDRLKVINQANQSDNLNYIILEGERFIKVMKKYLK